LSVWKQRNAALVRMVPEREQREGEREDTKKFWTLESARAKTLASYPAEAACFNLLTVMPSSHATFTITSQWVQKTEMTGGVAIAETDALTDHAIIGEDR